MRVLILFGRVRFELANKPVDPQQKGGITPVCRQANFARERSPNAIWTKQSGHPMPIFTAATSKD